MKTVRLSIPGWIAAGVAGLLAVSVGAAESVTNAPSLDSHLEPFRPLLNNTWRGPCKNTRSEKPIVDIARWERALNGRAIRTLHSINDGSYGGETLFMWNEEKKAVTFHYFTTAGFTTTGTVRFEDGKILTHEIVSGNSGGTSEVKSVCQIRPDGVFVVRAEHLKNGKWEPGRETEYREDPTAKVIFR